MLRRCVGQRSSHLKKGNDMKKAKLSLAWQILIGLVLGIALGALLDQFSADKAWWISNILQPAGDIFIRLIKMIVVPIVTTGAGLPA